MPDEIVEKVSSLLNREQDVLALFLFGSHARGNIKKGSDYDFYVLLDKNSKDSLREDQLSKKVFDAAREFGAEIHLTFQYLIVVDEDKSLLLKINDEGCLLFSKALILGSYPQFGLQKYYVCSWEVDLDKIPRQKNRKLGIRTSRQQILRLLKGYRQKYVYGGQEKVSDRQGMIDGTGLISATSGTPDILMVLDSMLHHLRHTIERHFGKLQVLYEVYIPREKINGLSRYRTKQRIEFHLQEKEAQKEVFVKSFQTFDGKHKLFVRYISQDQNKNTSLSVDALPKEIRDYVLGQPGDEITEEFK